MSDLPRLERIDETTWEIPASARQDMRVPARIFADEGILGEIAGDLSLEQLQNVATLPGVVGAAIAMPDIHQGYGFPVGGVAATELPDGVVSPGGVGYDINCGVRLLSTPLTLAETRPKLRELVDELFRTVPSGVGSSRSDLALAGRELDPHQVDDDGAERPINRHRGLPGRRTLQPFRARP